MDRLLGKIHAELASLAGATVAVLGVSFKPNTDDVRESPACGSSTGSSRRERGCTRTIPSRSTTRAGSSARGFLTARIRTPPPPGADALVIMTEWNEFRVLDLDTIKKLLRSPSYSTAATSTSRKRWRRWASGIIRSEERSDSAPRVARGRAGRSLDAEGTDHGRGGVHRIEFCPAALRARRATHVTVLDKLTYAGNLDNLRGFAERSDFRFVRGDICDARLLDGLLPGVDILYNFAAETHVDRSILEGGSFVRTDVLGTYTLLQRALKARVPVSSRFRPTRSTAASRGGASARRSHPAEQPLLGEQIGRRPPRARVLRDVRFSGGNHEELEQLRPLAASREIHPALHHERDRGKAASPLRTAGTSATGSTSRTTVARSSSSGAGGRWGRSTISARGRSIRISRCEKDNRAHGRERGAPHVRFGPPRARLAILPRQPEDPQARVAAAGRVRRRPRADRSLVREERALVEAGQGRRLQAILREAYRVARRGGVPTEGETVKAAIVVGARPNFMKVAP